MKSTADCGDGLRQDRHGARVQAGNVDTAVAHHINPVGVAQLVDRERFQKIVVDAAGDEVAIEADIVDLARGDDDRARLAHFGQRIDIVDRIAAVVVLVTDTDEHLVAVLEHLEPRPWSCVFEALIIEQGPEANAITMRVHERGAGVTRACGTGACAAADAALVWGLVPRSVEHVVVHMDGGDARVRISDDRRATLIGPTVFIANITVHA